MGEAGLSLTLSSCGLVLSRFSSSFPSLSVALSLFHYHSITLYPSLTLSLSHFLTHASSLLPCKVFPIWISEHSFIMMKVVSRIETECVRLTRDSEVSNRQTPTALHCNVTYCTTSPRRSEVRTVIKQASNAHLVNTRIVGVSIPCFPSSFLFSLPFALFSLSP